MSDNTNLAPAAEKPFSRRTLMQGAAALAGGTAAAAVLPLIGIATDVYATPDPTVFEPVTYRASSKKNIVETESGKVYGFVRNDIVSYLSIPYGATTAGKSRFMAPQKPTPWKGPRAALRFGPVSPQVYTSTTDGRREAWNYDYVEFGAQHNDGQADEACLVVNIWSPSVSDGKKRPVMVWIHGGGYSSGSSYEMAAYDGENLSRRGDAVVLSLNHRLGVLGYLNLSDYGDKWADASNAGMLDIVLALQWVKSNIAGFGGDPNNVMIFGQGGGGGKVSTLMAMPEAQGLFHRAAVQSGSPSHTAPGPDRSKELAVAVLAELNITADSIDKLQTVQEYELVEAGFHAQRKLPGTNWGPVVDGKHIPHPTWSDGAPSISANVPLLVGTVLNEFVASTSLHDLTLDDMPMAEAKKCLTPLLEDKTDHVVSVFQKQHPQDTPFELLSRITAARATRQNAVTQAERKAALNAAPAYLYWFQWQTPILDGKPRAHHTAELAFVFYNTDQCAAQTGGGPVPRTLAGKIADAWINFARAGDPNHPGLPQWPKFSKDQCQTMIFDSDCVVKDNPDTDERAAIMAQLNT